MAKNTVILEGTDVRHLLTLLGVNTKHTDIYKIRIWSQPESGVKIKINEGMWTPVLGKVEE